MTKMFLNDRLQTLLTVLICFVAVSGLAMGEDRFALTVGAHDHLVIFGPKGERAAEISAPTIAQPVTIGDVSFQVSYGRDANGHLTAILTPSSTAPAALHFNVLGKSVDADKAVVTLTFSTNLKSAIIDPGYVGNVEVNSHPLRHHHLADDTVIPRLTAPPNPTALTASVAGPTETPAPVSPATTPVVSAETAPAPSPEAAPSVLPHAPVSLASQLAPSILDQGKPMKDQPAAAPAASTTQAPTLAATPGAVVETGPATGTQVKLFWSEPVTPPNGPAPAVGLDEIKLVEVHGSVSVALANGETKTGVEGMIVPSGSTVTTLDNGCAALFMGGVNSARLMPRCELTVTQTLDGAVRKTLIDLQRGAVFSRVGQHSGETQDYKVRTPEGVADAETPDMLAFRGTLDDLNGTATTMNSGLVLNRKRLLAWSPAPLGHGWISDIADPVLGVPTLAGPPSTYFYFAKNTLSEISHQVFASSSALFSHPNSPSFNNPTAVLQGVLTELQPLNFKLQGVLSRLRNGASGPGDVSFYHNLVSITFTEKIDGQTYVLHTFSNAKKGGGIRPGGRGQVMLPFITPPITPF
jgi:hypothetical protein